MTGDLVVPLPEIEECTELHCEDEHPGAGPGDDALRHAINALTEAYHRTHDARFPWRLCTEDVCREITFALGTRS